MRSPSIHGWRRRPWMAGAIGGKTQRRDVWKDTMEAPANHGNSFRPWMGPFHPKMAESTNGMQHVQISLPEGTCKFIFSSSHPLALNTH